MENSKDPQLWEIAKKRASFKYHLAVYIVINIFLWAMWFIKGGNEAGKMYPVWATLGWGIGLAFHYLGAYVWSKPDLIEKEYDKLKNSK